MRGGAGLLGSIAMFLTAFVLGGAYCGDAVAVVWVSLIAGGGILAGVFVHASTAGGAGKRWAMSAGTAVVAVGGVWAATAFANIDECGL